MIRKWWTPGVLFVALVLLGPGCNTKKPTDAGEQTISIFPQADSSLLQTTNIWDVLIDQDGDGTFDDLFGYACEDSSLVESSSIVPWRYVAEVSIIRPGSTAPEVLATSIGTGDEFSSVTPYDDRILGTAFNRTVFVSIPDPQDPNQTILQERRWRNGKRVSQAHREFYEKCLGRVIPDANVLGGGMRFDVPVEQGATVIFKARKQPMNDADPFNIGRTQPILLSGFAFVDGVAVTPDGDSISTEEDGSGFSMSVRIR